MKMRIILNMKLLQIQNCSGVMNISNMTIVLNYIIFFTIDSITKVYIFN